MVSLLLLLAALPLLWSTVASAASMDAEQIHLSLGVDQNDWFVSYVTFDRPSSSFVQYGLSPTALSLISNASIAVFTDAGKAQKRRFMHEAAMPKLKPGTLYFYQVVTSSPTPSPLLNFTTIPAEAGYTQPLRIAMYGDFGLLNDQSHDRLEHESLTGNLDLIIHAGDMAYDMVDEVRYPSARPRSTSRASMAAVRSRDPSAVRCAGRRPRRSVHEQAAVVPVAHAGPGVSR